MRVQEVLNRTTDHFKRKGISTARLDAELLLSHALKWPRIQLYSQFDYPLGEEELDLCREVVKRRGEGEPVAYILGRKGFYKHDFIVNKSVLIPRPETECLLEKAIEKTLIKHSQEEELQIVDLGSGSGCLGLSLLKEFPRARLLAVDLSEGALKVTKENAKALEVVHRLETVLADAGELDLPPSDLIVANPPYIAEGDPEMSKEVEKYEPRQALIADDEGLSAIFSWARKAKEALRKNGLYFCEFGKGQEEEIDQFFQRHLLFEEIEYHRDLSGITRFLEARHG